MLINNDTIIKDDNPLLRTKSADIPLPASKDDLELAKTMMTYVKESIDPKLAQEKNLRPAVGISAIQVGIPKKITAIRIVMEEDENGQPTDVVELLWANAKIIKRSVQKAYLDMGEGCLSVPEEHPGHIQRAMRITVHAYDLTNGQWIDYKASGYLAICIQHELDHFNGVLFYDHIDPTDPMAVDENAICIS